MTNKQYKTILDILMCIMMVAFNGAIWIRATLEDDDQTKVFSMVIMLGCLAYGCILTGIAKRKM